MKVSVRAIDLHLEVPFAISRSTTTERRVVLLEVDDGAVVARGEATADPYFGETADALARQVRDAAGLLPDDPVDLASLRTRLRERFPRGGAAACAIDVAAHDRAAQHARVPLHAFLGLGTGAPPTSFTIAIAEPSLMAARAARAAARGFEVLKVKLGGGDEVAVLGAIRERFAGTIRVDPNGAWSADEAIARIARIARFEVEFVEQPVRPDDLAALRAVRERSDIPIVADEAAVLPGDLDRLVGCCDGVNVKLQKCGGIAEARAMIEGAHERGLRVMLGCRAAETSVGIAAAAHLAASVEWADLDGNLLVVDDPFEAVRVERGRFVYPDRPGLGALPRS